MKHYGTSHLADVARRAIDGVEHYPVRRRGQKRRLNPNQAGIDWLEGEDFKYDTEIMTTADSMGEIAGLCVLYARGRRHKLHPRPMFQVLPNADHIAFPGLPTPSCQCDRFEVSWACEEHQELPWDEKRKTWIKPGTAYYSPGAMPMSPIVRQMHEQLNQLAWQTRPVERLREVRPYAAEYSPGSIVRMDSTHATLHVEDEGGSFTIEVEGRGDDPFS